MHKSITLLVALAATTALIAGCAQRTWTAGDTGAVVGGAATAAVAHELAEGSSNQAIYTVAGAIVGAMLGRRVGRNMSGQDRRLFGRTLATNPAGQTNYWSNNASNDSYWVTPTSSTYVASNRVCREFRMKANINGRTDYVTGTACRQPNGTWVVQ